MKLSRLLVSMLCCGLVLGWGLGSGGVMAEEASDAMQHDADTVLEHEAPPITEETAELTAKRDKARAKGCPVMGKMKGKQLACWNNQVCPMTGNPAAPEFKLEYADEAADQYGVVYFCNAECVETAKESPARWYKKAYLGDDKAGTLKLRNDMCPVHDIKAAPEHTAIYNGLIIQLCSAEAKETFLADPDTYLQKLIPELEQHKEFFKARCPLKDRPEKRAKVCPFFESETTEDTDTAP